MRTGPAWLDGEVRGLDERREQAMRITEGKVFETEGTTSAKALRWKQAWCI